MKEYYIRFIDLNDAYNPATVDSNIRYASKQESFLLTKDFGPLCDLGSCKYGIPDSERTYPVNPRITKIRYRIYEDKNNKTKLKWNL